MSIMLAPAAVILLGSHTFALISLANSFCLLADVALHSIVANAYARFSLSFAAANIILILVAPSTLLFKMFAGVFGV